ncbi:uncharacterized protein LOC131019809 isoform X2 [Salvia miltiorrhiza]|uniref:uncharacterized protein LOC131019809 isoform X2 n=1 Tax=Salvia miltiorrhiza TaxID=226208 RepID=UPI0025AC0293|nr:uncharacterized protein LOC131019809 isoform X2 [Salvia miltiorrhiza]
MYDCVQSLNLHPQFSSRIYKLGSTTCLRLPKFVKCSVNDSNSTNSARDLGLREGSRGSKGWKDESEMEELAADRGIEEVFKFRATEKDYKLVKEDDIDSEMEGFDGRRRIDAAKSRRQMMRRSSVMAKQVISIRSALTLGFVTQLWVDTSSWVVMVVEVKPSLLSGDSERFLLKEITQVVLEIQFELHCNSSSFYFYPHQIWEVIKLMQMVGDVVLVEDEIVMEDDTKLIGLETLVRGYTFSISSGTLESLELDSFGISIIPSSLVSTYALSVDDVLEVFPDTVVVRDAAVSRLQRLTKGFWDGKNKELEEQLDGEGYAERQRKSRKSRRNRRKSVDDDWELPMDFL